MAVGQQAIAEKLDLSVATVSRALRNHKGINPGTRARVMDAASEMGYRLNSIRMTSGECPPAVVGILVCGSPSMRGAHAAVRTRILTGIAEEARRKDVALQVEYAPKTQVVNLRRRQWRGVILVGHFSAEDATRLARQALCVQVADYAPGTEIGCVDHDDASSCELLVDHLWKAGARRIGYVASGAPAPCRSARYAGTCGALARRGVLMPPEDAIGLTEDGMPMARVAALVRSRAEAGVQAWICENDFVGYGLIEHLRPFGLDCPRDLLVCGFDNLEPPAGIPKLTTVDAPFEEMGAMALSRLMQRLSRDPLETMHIMLACRLLVGDSTKRGAS